MNLTFFTESRFIQADDGRLYNHEGSLNLQLWKRYLEYFSTLCIVARVKSVKNYKIDESKLASDERIKFIAVPYFIGPEEYLLIRNKVRKAIKGAMLEKGAFLIRSPGRIGYIASKELKKNKIPYGVEVVGDPFDVFTKGAIRHPLRIFFRYKSSRELKYIVANSSCALYVTKYRLQNRYPAKKGVFTTNASDVILNDETIIENPRKFVKKKKYCILCIGSLAQMYKSPDVVLQSIKELKEMEVNCHLNWLGSGRYIEDMKRLALKLVINDRVNFTGYISERKKMLSYYDEADIFVLVSRTEGLPRVIIEAMARGLPVIGTRVGGIPELVEDDMLIERNDSRGLTRKILYLINNVDVAQSIGNRNLNKSKEYSESKLNLRRKSFYECLMNQSL